MHFRVIRLGLESCVVLQHTCTKFQSNSFSNFRDTDVACKTKISKLKKDKKSREIHIRVTEIGLGVGVKFQAIA